MTTILGIHYGHDSNYAVLRDGKIIIHTESERTTRVKHQVGFHEESLQRALASAEESLDSIDAIALSGGSWAFADASPPAWAQELLKLGQEATPTIQRHIVDELSAHHVTTSMRLGQRTIPVHIIHHHIAHVAMAYYQSPMQDAHVVSWDGGGDMTNLLWMRMHDGKIDKVMFDPPDGLHARCIGGGWSAIGPLYGWPGGDHEGKVMGHAAYGTPQKLLQTTLRYFIDTCSLPPLWTTRCQSLKETLRAIVDFSSAESESLKNLSASIQSVTEDVMLEILQELGITPDDNLVLTGGCAYNCVANSAVQARYPNTYVTSCAHDGGLGLGAALFAWHHIMQQPFSGMPEASAYLGHGEWTATETAAEQAVEDLLAGRIVAWFDGPAESGRRALGARSILLDPRRADGKDLLNNNVKKREWFRPFAPSVLSDHSEWSKGPLPPSWYMSFSAEVANDWLEKIPAVLHVDGTCRPQIVTGRHNPVYRKIIELFYAATGVPMVLNTSFNVQEPIIDTPWQALRTFARSGIDVLYINGRRIVKS